MATETQPCPKKLWTFRRSIGTARAVLVRAALALAITAVLPLTAHAVNTCNALLTIDYVNGPAFSSPGDVLRVKLTLGTGSIQGGTQVSIDRVRFGMDCNNNFPLVVPCTDEGSLIEYQGDATITTDCGVVWTSGHGVSDAPNDVVFTPSSSIIIGPNVANPPGFCSLEFDIKVLAASADNTPALIEEVAGFSAAALDATCNNGLASSGTQSSSIALCIACDDNNACTTDACDPDTGQCVFTPTPPLSPCPDTDGSPCTTPACDGLGTCDQAALPFAFLVREKGKVGNGGTIDGSIGANDPGGSFGLGKTVFMTDGSIIAADHVRLGQQASVWTVLANQLKQGAGAIIRNPPQGTPVLPLTNPYCPIPALNCGGADVTVPQGGSVTLAPGSYGRVTVLTGGTLTLDPGTFDWCTFRTTRTATVVVTGPGASTINISEAFRLSNNSTFGPEAGAPTPTLVIGGSALRIGAASTLQAFVSAPNATLRIGRSGVFRGTFCVDSSKSDKLISLICPP